MLFLISIPLIIVAWIRGWKWRALYPLGIWFGVSVFLGFVSHATGVEPFSHPEKVMGFFVDMGLFIALVVMIIKKPSS